MEPFHSPYRSYSPTERVRQVREEIEDGYDYPNYPIEQYIQWIQEQYTTVTENKRESLNDSVSRILLYYFKGNARTDKETFLVLVNCVLEYADLLSDKLLLISSLLDELVDSKLTEPIIPPLIEVDVSYSFHL